MCGIDGEERIKYKEGNIVFNASEVRFFLSQKLYE